jgi:hypothetical protein
VHQVRVRGPTGIPGGQRIYALESPVVEGGVGETISLPDKELNLDGKYKFTDEDVGIGITNLWNELISDGVDGFGVTGVGEIMGLGEDPD